MFQSWRQKLREVEDDLRVGRLDEALRALQEGGLLDFLPGKRLGDRLALMFAERAKRRAAESDLAGGWRDWASAVSLAELPASDVARRCLVDAGLLQVTRLADRRDFAGAAAQLDRWERHAASHAEVQAVRQTLRVLDAAMHLMAHGKFEEANEQLRRARELCPTWAVTGPLAEECREKQRQTRPLAEALFQSLSAENWPRVMQLADSLLAFAPQWKAARQARQRAWQQAGTRLDSTVAGQRDGDWQETEERGAAMTRGSADDRVRGGRFLLWVDGVGGYLVCLGDEVALGQQVPGNDVDVPILGDLSRRHARIRRSGEGYVIEAAQPLRVNGQVANPARSLADGDELELGSGVRFRFRQPHPLSATARLDPLSGHRTHPYVDGVLLMAESCVLGPKWQDHVVCRDWSGDVVLYRRDGELYCRASAPVEIDGRLCEGRGKLTGNARVVGSDFSLSLEELDKCSSQPLR